MSGRLIEWYTVRATPRTSSSSLSSTAPTKHKRKPRRRRAVGAKTGTQRERSQLYNLTLDLSTLRQQISDLTQHRALLYTRALYTKFDRDGSLVQTTRAFMALTRSGQALDDASTRDCFFAVVDETLAFGPFHGRDQYVTSCNAFASRFATTAFVVHTIHAPDEAYIVRIDGHVHGELTNDAIHSVYPAVLNDPQLAKTLRGVPVQVPITTYITFGTHGRIVRIDVDVDFVGLLVRLLADVVKAGELIDHAARDKRGLLYLNAKAEAEDQAADPPRVETVWGIESASSPPSGDSRLSVDFLLS